MASKFYVVWSGITPGVYTSWEACSAQVTGVKGSRFKSFPSWGEALAQYEAGPPVAVSAKRGRGNAKRDQPLAAATGTKVNPLEAYPVEDDWVEEIDETEDSPF